MAKDRGELIEYCWAHDYTDPGYPPIECAACRFEKDQDNLNTKKVTGRRAPRAKKRYT